MDLKRYKTFILVLCAAAALLVASPALQQLLVYPQADNLTEFWLLGSNHDGAYPNNVTAGQNTRIYLDVSNHLGSCAYYVVEIKFRNQTQSGPDTFKHTGSDLAPLSSLTLFLADNASTELPLDFSFQYKVDPQVSSRLDMQSVTVNSFTIPITSTSLTWDINKGGFYGNLFFELWIYNGTTNSLQYHERYISLWLRMNT